MKTGMTMSGAVLLLIASVLSSTAFEIAAPGEMAPLSPTPLIGTLSVRVEHALVFSERLLDGLRFLLGRIARVGGGRRAAEAHQAGHQQQPGFRRFQILPADENALRCGKAFVIAAPGDGDRDSGVDGGFQYSRARCRGDRPEWSVPFDNEPGERVTLEVPAD